MIMTLDEKKALVRTLSDSIADNVCKSIDAGHVPDDWDGHELRALLAEKWREVTRLMTDHRSIRHRAYERAVILGNL